jgi:hypothetical protein
MKTVISLTPMGNNAAKLEGVDEWIISLPVKLVFVVVRVLDIECRVAVGSGM